MHRAFVRLIVIESTYYKSLRAELALHKLGDGKPLEVQINLRDLSKYYRNVKLVYKENPANFKRIIEKVITCKWRQISGGKLGEKPPTIQIKVTDEKQKCTEASVSFDAL